MPVRATTLAFLTFLTSLVGFPSAFGAQDPCMQPEEERIADYLCGTTTIEASSASAVRVNLLRPASFTVPVDPDAYYVGKEKFAPGTDINIEDEGSEVVGFAIRDVEATSSIYGLRLPEAAGPVRDRFWQRGEDLCFGGFPWVCTLPAGEYFVYVFSSGTPLRLILQLHGLEGTSTLEASQPTFFRARSPRPYTEEATGQRLYVAGEKARMPADMQMGLAVVWLVIASPTHVASHYSLCQYYDGDVPEPGAYLPGCPYLTGLVDNGHGEAKQGGLMAKKPTDGIGGHFYGDLASDPDANEEVALGLSFTSHSLAADSTVVARVIWLSLDTVV